MVALTKKPAMLVQEIELLYDSWFFGAYHMQSHHGISKVCRSASAVDTWRGNI